MITSQEKIIAHHKEMRVNKITPITRISISLILLTISILLSANWIGLTPDRDSAYLNSRIIIAESIAVQVSKLAETGKLKIIKTILDSLHERNKEITALSLQLTDKSTPINVGSSKNIWDASYGDVSTPTRILVPIFSGKEKWGRIAITFTPLGEGHFLGIPVNIYILFLIYIAVIGYTLYYLFLKRALHYLDPASVIPEHVKTAMDVLSEGVLILDDRGRIVLANKSFTQRTGAEQSSLLGKRPETLPWTFTNKNNKNDKLPWAGVINNSTAQTAVALSLNNKENEECNFMVNSSPILDEKGNIQGALATFDDVTRIERRNTQLSTMLDRLKEKQAVINNKNKELKILASQDSLTGCLNRRSFYEIMDNIYQNISSSEETFSCIMLDIDFFKAVNDNYGHGAGDEVIKSVSQVMRESLRDGDKVCRYGGEEFCLLLRNTSASQAMILSDRIRKDVENLDFSDDPELINLKVTISIGVSDSKNNAKNTNEIINQADYALYGAKESGRNRVMLWGKMLSETQKETIAITRENETTSHPGNETKSLDKDDKQNASSSQRIFLQIVDDVLTNPINPGFHNAILIIDINDFKRINNILGYEVGDKLLQEKHRRLSNTLRNTDILTTLNENDNQSVTRLNGDRFGVILHNLPSKERTASIVDRIILALAEPYHINGHVIYATCSIGISISPENGNNADTLFMHSENAMNHAKNKRGNNYHFYTQESDTDTIDNFNLENDLRNALSNDEMVIYYQPKIDLVTNKICGMESLIRWRHPLKGLVLPSDFLPIAESTGLIHEIGLWVFSQACKQVLAWEKEGYDGFSIAVNISATQFIRSDFVENITKILDFSGANPKLLEIEVTENAMIHNISRATTSIEKLRSIGIKSSLDDFGTGYSSLHHIKQFPIDSLKIDISFINNILNNKDDVAIVSAVINMSHAMGIKVIAEGVENNEQLLLLKELGCDQVQGYFISRPKPQADMTILLESQSSIIHDSISSSRG